MRFGDRVRSLQAPTTPALRHWSSIWRRSNIAFAYHRKPTR